MTPQTAGKLFAILFRLNAFVLCTAALTIPLPDLWMQNVHQWLGLGEMPSGNITRYLARSCSMLYALHGIVLLVVSFDLNKYRELVYLLVLLHMALGATVLVIDLSSGMPWYWTAGEGPGIIVFATLLLWLWKKSDQGTSTDSSPG